MAQVLPAQEVGRKSDPRAIDIQPPQRNQRVVLQGPDTTISFAGMVARG